MASFAAITRDFPVDQGGARDSRQAKKFSIVIRIRMLAEADDFETRFIREFHRHWPAKATTSDVSAGISMIFPRLGIPGRVLRGKHARIENVEK